jgi:hypothetical protein
MDHADQQAPFPPSEQVDSGPLAEIQLTRQQQPLCVDHSFSRLVVHQDEGPGASPIEIVSGLDWPQLHARYVIVQEEVVRRDPRRGWAPVGGVYPDHLLIGPSDASQLDFSAAVGKDDGVLVGAYETFLSLTACGSTAAIVRVGVADLLTVAEASSRRLEGAPAR